MQQLQLLGVVVVGDVYTLLTYIGLFIDFIINHIAVSLDIDILNFDILVTIGAGVF